MDLTQFKIGVDVWEGSLDIQEQTLLDAGVSFMFIRMNDTYGRPLPDNNFLNQWVQAASFQRAAYYVVSPNYSAAQHFAYISAHKPSDMRVISLDIEIRGADPARFTALVNDLIRLCQQAGLFVILYSGGGFTTLLNPWPKSIDYWWAAYWLYPQDSVVLSWDQAKKNIASCNWIGNPSPGHCAIWQITGDRYKLPGCAGRAIDLNVMPIDDFNRIFKPQTNVYMPIIVNNAIIQPGATLEQVTTAVADIQQRMQKAGI